MQHNINWNRIYLDYSPKLLGVCRRYVPDLVTAEDLLQDSFLTAIQKQNQLKSPELLYAWLKKIVVNNCLLHLRNSHKNLFVVTEPQNIPDPSSPMTTTEDSNLILGYEFTTDELLWSIDQLPPHHRSVFNLYYLENFSHSEIAENLGININTSKSHLLRAKKGIKQHLMTKTEGQKLSPIKKNGIKALVFLGFGNLLWAQAFQNKFKNFTIEPQKTIDFSNINTHLTFSNPAINLQTQILKKAFTFIAFFTGLMLYNDINERIPIFNSPKLNNESPQSINIKSSETAVKPLAKNSPESAPKIQKKRDETVNKIQFPQKEKTFGSNKLKTETSAAEISPKLAVAEIPDTTQTDKKPVVIIKKVVKKVKVYVEK